MLGWITGQNEEEKQYTENSRIAEPPQTPAPVFAIRAFKSALFGTPAGEDDTVGQAAFSERQADSIRPKNNPISQISEWPKMPEKQNSNSANQLSQSPTKSILVTPGTLASRRKTVSFGSTVHHDDLRNSQDQKTTPSAPGSVTNQWMSAQASMNSKPRSKLTQSLLDAREKPAENLPRHISPARSEKLPTANQNQNTMSVENVGQNDVTINLDDPQSQSGQYWKTEFENYRKRTNLEIRKLIQYRSVARSYARKKDAETMRLTEKLRKEEEKFAEMERRVTGLASSMVSKGADVDKEELVQELTRQTALVVQYKHKVDTLRNALQRHGVVGGRDDETDADESVKEDKKEIRRLKHALDQANKKLEEKNHDDELGKVRNLAKSSEAKVSKLEKENAELKKGISRLMEASKDYEERRVEREAKLKQRAMKMELRNQELKGRLNQYRNTFQQETKMYQEEIKILKTKIPDVEQLQRPDRLEDTYQKLPEAYAGIEIQDFGNHRVQTYSRHPQEMLQVGNRDPNPRKLKPSDLNPEFSDEKRIAKRGNEEEVAEPPQRTSNGLPQAGLLGIGPDPVPLSPLEPERPSPSHSKKYSITSRSTFTEPLLQMEDLISSDDRRHQQFRIQARSQDALSSLPLSQSRWAPSSSQEGNNITPERAASA